MNIDAAHPLYLLPFDHRASFKTRLLGIAGTLDAAQRRRVTDLKMLIWEGFEHAVAKGAPMSRCGILVDEEFGAEVARAARSAGVVLAMPVERSGQDDFELEYGDCFASHVEAFDPDFVKVLVRYNPEGERSLNAAQDARLAALSLWLRAQGRRLLFELLIPPTAAQTAATGGDPTTYERDALPGLIVGAMVALQAAGVEPDIWKIQGIDDRAGCAAAAAQARSGGRDDVVCIVLGHGAEAEAVRRWLAVAASVEGYAGFAAGRTIWRDALVEYVANRTDRQAARDRIAANYLGMIATYQAAAGSIPENTPFPAVPAKGGAVAAPAARGGGA